MPPKGRKKAVAAAKSDNNGIETENISNQDKIEAIKSGRGRKKAKTAESEDLGNKPVLDEGKEQGANSVDNDDVIDEKQIEAKKSNGENTSDAIDDEMSASEGEDAVGSAVGDAVPEKVAGKRGRKKAGDQKLEQVAVKSNGDVLPDAVENETAISKEEPEKHDQNKAGVSEDDEVAEAEEEPEKDSEAEPEKVLVKRGRKKAEVVEDEVATTDAKEHTLVRRGRKKAGASEEIEDEVAPTEAKEEPEKSVGRRGRKKAVAIEAEITEPKEEPVKVSGKRNRKKSEDTVSAKQDEAMEDDEEHTPPAKRSQNTKSAVTKKNKVAEKIEEDEDFAPRRTRGGRNVKEVPKEVAPLPKGRKRKAKDENAEAKNVKKGRAAKESPEEHLSLAQIDENRRLAVSIERDHKLDEMARNTSLEEETETKEIPAKGTAKSGRKRGNQNAEDSKPEKVQKEEPSKAKSGSKKQQILDVSVLDFENASKTPDGKPWNFKIASWNVNGVRAWLEKNGLSYLHHEKPDVLCVQETKCADDKLPKELEVEGYHCHWLAGDKDGYSGVGVLSKEKPISITDGIGIEEHDNEGRAITVEYEKFYLVNTYVPNSGRGLVKLDYRKKWDEDFHAYLKTLDEKKPVVLCGDLNVAHEEIDIANPKGNKKSAGFTQEERDGLTSLLKKGFVDTFRHLYPEAKSSYTFWTYMMNARAKNVGWRLDYFVISERFKDHLCDSLIRKEVMGSDHCPVGLLLHV